MRQNNVVIRMPTEQDFNDDKVQRLCDLINQSYQEADKGIWQEIQRIDFPTLKNLLRQKAIIIAEMQHNIVGCINVNLLNERIAEFSTFAVDKTVQHQGIGDQLMKAAEKWAKDNHRQIAQIEVIYPRNWQHPYKEFVKKWCENNGYKPEYKGPFEKLDQHIIVKLTVAKVATPCDFVIYHKELNE